MYQAAELEVEGPSFPAEVDGKVACQSGPLLELHTNVFPDMVA